jgi:pyruvate dehydrogenase E1 component alpha subunit
VETLISDKYKDQIFRCPVHLSIGQEAIAVGVTSLLRTDDKVISTHRSHAHYLAKGGDLFRMFCEILGSRKGCCGGRGGSMHLIDKSAGFFGSIPIVGSSLPISAGLALAEKLENTGNVVVAFIGDAALETGAFYETLNLAALKKLPLVIVIEDNGYSTYANKSARIPTERSTKQLFTSFGVPFTSSIGDDVREVVNASLDAIRQARDNQPSALEFQTFRLLEHCGPNRDDHLGYREHSEIAEYENRDPISIAREFLRESIPLSLLNRIDILVKDYVNQVFANALIQRNGEFESFLEVRSS